MKKIEIIFESLYCDMCSYEISIITKKIIGVANFTIYRKTNTLIINLKNRASISLEEIKNSFENEDYIVRSIKERDATYTIPLF
jgi:hypothetical protein